MYVMLVSCVAYLKVELWNKWLRANLENRMPVDGNSFTWLMFWPVSGLPQDWFIDFQISNQFYVLATSILIVQRLSELSCPIGRPNGHVFIYPNVRSKTPITPPPHPKGPTPPQSLGVGGWGNWGVGMDIGIYEHMSVWTSDRTGQFTQTLGN